MLDNLTQRLARVMKTLRGEARLTEDNIASALREVRLALLEADVALPAVKALIAAVKEKAVGEDVIGSLSPGQALIGVVHRELTALMGEQAAPLSFNRDVRPILAALQRAGAKVYKEVDLAAALSLVETEDHNPVTATVSTDNGSMSCPKCGHEQNKADECSACGIIIDKYLARQAELAASAPTITVTSTASGAPSPASPYAPPTANVAEYLPEYAELRPCGIEGRIGRLRYLAWSVSLMFAAMGVFGVIAISFQISEILAAILGVLALVAMMVVSVQIGVQRLHDIGWSGWLLLLNLVPVVGSVFAIIMLLAPGSPAANRFGPPPPPNSTAVKVLSILCLLVPLVFILLCWAMVKFIYRDIPLEDDDAA